MFIVACRLITSGVKGLSFVSSCNIIFQCCADAIRGINREGNTYEIQSRETIYANTQAIFTKGSQLFQQK